MSDKNYRRVKWALIGAGFFGDMYAQVMTSLPNVELVSLFSAHDENLNKVGDKFNIKKRSTDFREIINDDEIEAVAVITIEHHHYEPVMEAIKAGKHIIVEKPLAPKVSECKEMIEAAEKAGVTLAVYHILPFSTHYAMVKNEN